MSQLLVRDIEPSVVAKLRRSAVEQGVSVEEAHRRLLRTALLGDQPGPQEDFLAYLRGIPTGKAIDFPRATNLPRSVEL